MQATTRNAGRIASAHPSSTPAAASAAPHPAPPRLLGDPQRKALITELETELRQRVRAQVTGRTWPGRLATWSVTAEGRVLAGVQTRCALVWLDAGAAPEVDPNDPRLQQLLADRRAREERWRQGRGKRPATRR